MGRLSGMVIVILVLFGCDGAGSDGGDDRVDDDTTAFTATSVSVQSDTLTLPGTLLAPDTSAAVPGVVVVHGSGPLDRDGRSPGADLPPIYKEWAERVARGGLAVLRYDKRTILTEVQRADPRDVTFLDFVRDAVAAGRLLRAREGVDGDRIAFVGHSQGGNVVPAAATRMEAVAGVASLAGPAVAIDSLFVAQLDAGGGSPNCTADQARAQFDSLRAGRSPSDGLICGAGVTFWRQWMRHSQKMDSVVAAMEPPVLSQQGRADQNYPAGTLQRNIDAWRRIERADDATVEVYSDVDHLFRVAGTSTTADAPLDDLVTWIQKQ